MRRLLITICTISMILALDGNARPMANWEAGLWDTQVKTEGVPAVCSADHRINRLQLTVTNVGQIGNGFTGGWDCFTGEVTASEEYPSGSGVSYLFGGALWIGGIVNGDTLVTTGTDGWSMVGTEFNPDESPQGDMIHQSLYDSLTPDAISHDDIIAVYMDTLPVEDLDMFGRAHMPMNLEVKQTSMAWDYPHTDDFVLFDFQITNHSSVLIESAYVGLYVDGDVGHRETCTQNNCWYDDLTGFIQAVDVIENECIHSDTLNLAWIADNDGDPGASNFDLESARHITATRMLSNSSSGGVSFNWWLSNGNPALDFGPREKPGMGIWPEPWFDFGTGGIGTPVGDVNKYYMMMNREIDYDQIYIASITENDQLWSFPELSYQEHNFSDGMDTKYLLSVGPFDIGPGETIPFAFAKVGGENLHVSWRNGFENLISGYDPDKYYRNLSFSNLVENAKTAGRVYDAPGVDTDGDGYYGKFYICCDSAMLVCDTVYYEGDGVPDYKAEYPPLPPKVWLTSTKSGTIHVRFNGMKTETGKDPVTMVRDFEGYEIYYGFGTDLNGASLVTIYDRDDYLKYTWNQMAGAFELLDQPLTLEELRCLYGSSCQDLSFHPLDYPASNPFVWLGSIDSIFYFENMGNNYHEFGVNTDIQKTYPAVPYPTTLNPSLAEPWELTPDGQFKYFEYQAEINNLLQVEFCVSVVGTDFGNVFYGTEVDPTGPFANIRCITVGEQCCVGTRGNVDSSPDDMIDISDIVALVDYLFRGGPAPLCPAEANINGLGGIDISDLVYLVDYVFRGGPIPPVCQ